MSNRTLTQATLSKQKLKLLGVVARVTILNGQWAVVIGQPPGLIRD